LDTGGGGKAEARDIGDRTGRRAEKTYAREEGNGKKERNFKKRELLASTAGGAEKEESMRGGGKIVLAG